MRSKDRLRRTIPPKSSWNNIDVDFKQLAEEALKQGKEFYGVIIGTRDKGLKTTLREILRILQDYDRDDLKNNLLYFP
jgi:hypothetical protein